MRVLASLPIPVVVGLLLTPILISAGQILFKLTSRRAGAADLSGLVGLLLDPYLVTALAIYGLGTLVWIYVLKSAPLVTAYPFMALTFCLVPLLAFLVLGEPLSLRYGLGVGLIMTGLLVITS